MSDPEKGRQGEPMDSRDDLRRRGSEGFTLVEIIIAMVVLAVGVLGVAGTTAYVVRQVTLANVMTQRAVALQTAVERLQSLPYDSVGSGSDSVGRFGLTWTSTTETSTSKLVDIVTTGPGLSSSSGSVPFLTTNVADTFQIRVITR